MDLFIKATIILIKRKKNGYSVSLSQKIHLHLWILPHRNRLEIEKEKRRVVIKHENIQFAYPFNAMRKQFGPIKWHKLQIFHIQIFINVSEKIKTEL